MKGLLVASIAATVATAGCAEQVPRSKDADLESPGAQEAPADTWIGDSTALSAPPLRLSEGGSPSLVPSSGLLRVGLPPAAFGLLPPDFQVWTSRHYWAAITNYGFYESSERQQMSAVLADFNSDGKVDAVVDGWTGDSAVRLALLSDGSTYVLDEILRRPLSPGELETTEAVEFLSLADPGRYAQSFTDVPREVDLTVAGYMVSYFEKGATLYYLRNGDWQALVLSD